MSKVLAQAVFHVSTRLMELNYILCRCVFLFISSLSTAIPLVLCIKKFNSISNSLPCFCHCAYHSLGPFTKEVPSSATRLPVAFSCSPMLSSLYYFLYFLRSSFIWFFFCFTIICDLKGWRKCIKMQSTKLVFLVFFFLQKTISYLIFKMFVGIVLFFLPRKIHTSHFDSSCYLVRRDLP